MTRASRQLMPMQTVATVISFVLAMIRYPDVQRKAQEEIDRVVGQDRLPDFGDQESLPYINAVLLETLRWLPATPQGE
jgi:cytochrome P450